MNSVISSLFLKKSSLFGNISINSDAMESNKSSFRNSDDIQRLKLLRVLEERFASISRNGGEEILTTKNE
jgi:hypothetical protein